MTDRTDTKSKSERSTQPTGRRAFGTRTQTLVRFAERWGLPDAAAPDLCRQLYGYDLPAVGGDEEPYRMLLTGVRRSVQRSIVERNYAVFVSEFLRQRPDVSRRGTRPDDLLYNLFMFCAGLDRPDELCEPLRVIYEDQRVRSTSTLDERTRGALRSALIMNQTDAELWPLWRKFYQQQGDPLLPGSPFDGFEGVLFMPARNETGDESEPHLEAMGEALGCLAKWLEPVYERRQRFRELTHRVKAAYPDRDSWDEDFIRMADEHNWPRWSIESVDSLYVVLEKASNTSERIWLWHYILACVPAQWIVKTKYEPLCAGVMQEAVVNREGAHYVRNIAGRFERVRRNNPFPSERSISGIVAQVMNDFQFSADAEAERIYKLLEQLPRDDKNSAMRNRWESISIMLRLQALTGYKATLNALVAYRDMRQALPDESDTLVDDTVAYLESDVELSDPERGIVFGLYLEDSEHFRDKACSVGRPHRKGWEQKALDAIMAA